MSSVFDTLSGVNVNEHTEKKKTGGVELTYLSWPWAWAEIKKRYPDAHYTVWKDEKGRPYSFDPETGYMVYTSVEINGIAHEMWLPVMDGANKAMKAEPYEYAVKNPYFKYAKLREDGKYYDKYGNEQTEYNTKSVDAASMFDINKTIMRCLVKNLAMFGLGLYIYAGEDLPEGEEPQIKTEPLPDDAFKPGEKVDLPPAGSWNLGNAMGLYCTQHGIKVETFAKLREALIAGNIVKDIPSKKLDPIEFDNLCKAMEATFPDQLKVSA